MSAQPARGYLGISDVLAQLRAEFPDISVSKIRFLETEGLIAPARAPSGYRRFAAADVDRLRDILTAQRDQYLPLRVIKERLVRDEPLVPDRAGAAAAGGGADAAAGVGRADPLLSRRELLTRRELLDAAGITEPQLTELDSYGLLRKVGRHYGADALEVARTAGVLATYGVQPRHLPAVRAAVEREVNLIEGVVAPILKQRGAGARELAGQTAGELGGLALRLHRALLEGALAEAGLAEAGLSAAGAGDVQASPAARGVEGASA
jgi:DNA-binding transcriptional MerR regulator